MRTHGGGLADSIASTGVADALRLIATVDVDAALLDMKLQEEFAGEVADALAAHGIPFVFVSGYSRAPSARYAAVPILLKPFDIDELKKAVAEMPPGSPDVFERRVIGGGHPIRCDQSVVGGPTTSIMARGDDGGVQGELRARAAMNEGSRRFKR